MLEKLKEKVLEANMLLPKYDLVTFTWGNVSEIDRSSGLVVIKPSGVEYGSMCADDMVVVDLDGNVVEGRLRPSSDMPTHLELYKAFKSIGAVVHTHSPKATAWSQAGKDLPCYGTTHADYFYGTVPCTRPLSKSEVGDGYERNTGLVIAETFAGRDAMSCPGVLCRNHGPFTWGLDAFDAVHNAVVLEEISSMAIDTLLVNPDAECAPRYVMDKHYFRKHGKDAYYGQG